MVWTASDACRAWASGVLHADEQHALFSCCCVMAAAAFRCYSSKHQPKLLSRFGFPAPLTTVGSRSEFPEELFSRHHRPVVDVSPLDSLSKLHGTVYNRIYGRASRHENPHTSVRQSLALLMIVGADFLEELVGFDDDLLFQSAHLKNRSQDPKARFRQKLYYTLHYCSVLHYIAKRTSGNRVEESRTVQNPDDMGRGILIPSSMHRTESALGLNISLEHFHPAQKGTLRPVLKYSITWIFSKVLFFFSEVANGKQAVGMRGKQR